MANSRVSRGRRTQEVAAAFIREHGWPDAESVPASRPGMDIIKGIPGTAPEVKARRDFNPTAWHRQAKKNAAGGQLAFVIMRPDGAGEQSVGAWLAFLTFDDLLTLLKEAGYQ